jgi:carboxylesterase
MVAHPGAGPFDLGPAGAPRVVLLHGFTGTPAELWPLGLGLAAAGYHVQAPLWLGHGTTPEELARTSANDLMASARQLMLGPSPPCALVGLSMGSLLAVVAASGPVAPQALVLMGYPSLLTGPSGLFQQVGRLPWLSRIPVFLSKSTDRLGVAAVTEGARSVLLEGSPAQLAAAQAADGTPPSTSSNGRYDRVPLGWATEFRRLQAEARLAAPRVRSPALLLHGLLDKTASPSGTLDAARWLGGETRVRFFRLSPHVLTLGPERGLVAAEVTAFLESRVKRTDAPMVAQSA